MERILVATDFSSRSDRAIRRAVLTAKQFDSELILLHVVNDDQPASLVRSHRRAATALLTALGRTIRDVDGLSCTTALRTGAAFKGILDAAEEVSAEVIVLGAHRRQLLRDLFAGTTAERVIRFGHLPVLMANAVPVDFYGRLLLAVDFSDSSAEAVRTVVKLGLDRETRVAVMHAFDEPVDSLVRRSGMTDVEIEGLAVETQARAAEELAAFLRGLNFKPISTVLRAGSPADAIRCCARQFNADLIILGAHGYSALTKLIWGSVAEDVLRMAERDVLIVSPHPR